MLVRATLNPCPAPHGCGRPAGGATPSTLLVWDTRPCPQVSFQTLLLPRASDALHSLLRADDPSLSESVLPSQTPLVCPSPALTDETADQLSLSAEGREPGGQGIRWRDCTWPLSQARRGVRWHWHSRSFLGRLPAGLRVWTEGGAGGSLVLGGSTSSLQPLALGSPGPHCAAASRAARGAGRVTTPRRSELGPPIPAPSFDRGSQMSSAYSPRYAVNFHSTLRPPKQQIVPFIKRPGPNNLMSIHVLTSSSHLGKQHRQSQRRIAAPSSLTTTTYDGACALADSLAASQSSDPQRTHLKSCPR